MAEERREDFGTTIVPLSFGYNNRAGKYIERYLSGLKDKKFLGVRCSGCNRVIIPPRSICGPCNRHLNEWVEVSDCGVVENFTIGYVRVERGQLKSLDEPSITGLLKLDGSHTPLVVRIKGINPEEMKTGMRFKAVWREETKGQYTDILHFEPE